jgi:hypothetical protein
VIEWHLKIGNKQTELVVRQDSEYPQLYRIHYKGRISDMVNLSRAKDAAVSSWLRPRLGPTENPRWDHREILAAARW